jgi:hypothetical protein
MPAGTYLALAFFCSFDVSFDDADVVVVGLRKAGSVNPADTRRIDIFPVRDDIGAGLAGDPYVTLAGTPAGNDYHVRTDKQPLTKTIWKGRSPTPADPSLWEPAAPANVEARIASWRPATPGATTTAATNVPSGTTTFTIQVDSTGGLPATGAVVLDPAGVNKTISYTGKDGTHLTGCRNRDGTAASVPAGADVRVAAVGWSIELLLPTATGSDWIPLDDNFGIYFDIVRISRYDAGGAQFLSQHFATQYVFPLGLPPLTGILDETTAIPAYGTARIGAVAKGVGFQNQANPSLSIGARKLGGGALLGTIEGSTGNFDNELVAQLVNTDETNAAPNVTAEFRLANWGVPPATFASWAQASGAATPTVINPPLPANGGTGEVTSEWLRANVPSTYLAHKHQCMWVRLTSTSTVHFSQGGTRRNMDFLPLSEHEEDVEISGVGYGTPADGSEHEMLLVPSVREILVADAGPMIAAVGREGRQTYHKVMVWTVDSFRRTADTITIGKVTAEVLDPTPGQFGAIALHDDPADVLGFQFTGGGIQWTTGGFLSVRVPPEKSVTGHVRLNAAPREVIAAEDDEYLREHPPVPVKPIKPGGGGGTPTPGSGGGGSRLSCLPQALATIGLIAIAAAMYRRLRR